MKIDTICVSDLHLGTVMSRAGRLLAELKLYQEDKDTFNFNRLILNGDIFEDLNFNRLSYDQWELLSFFRKLSNAKRKVHVIWIQGNHDNETLNIASRFIGIEVSNEYQWEYEGKKYIAVHGDQFDTFIVNNIHLTKAAIRVFLALQKFHPFNRMIDRLTTRWSRMSPRVKAGALEYAKKKKVDGIFCGHTHIAELVVDDDTNIVYGNSGSWVQIPSSYLTIGDEGIFLKFVK